MDAIDKNSKSSDTLRTTKTERRWARKVSSWVKCLMKMTRPCRKTEKKNKLNINKHEKT